MQAGQLQCRLCRRDRHCLHAKSASFVHEHAQRARTYNGNLVIQDSILVQLLSAVHLSIFCETRQQLFKCVQAPGSQRVHHHHLPDRFVTLRILHEHSTLVRISSSAPSPTGAPQTACDPYSTEFRGPVYRNRLHHKMQQGVLLRHHELPETHIIILHQVNLQNDPKEQLTTILQMPIF